MKHVNPENLLIIDIETVSECPTFDKLPDTWQKLWKDKVFRSLPEGINEENFYVNRAGVMAEFSKIICISMGYFNKETHLHLYIRSFFDDDEKLLLENFIATLNKINAHSAKWSFAGHNIKEFDIPFICRRILVNQLPIPSYLDFQNMKPWETSIIDTFQFWRFGDYKNFTSLNLLAQVLNVPSSKDDIDGSMVGPLYWSAKEDHEKAANIKRIVTYCQKDVVTTANIILR